MTRKTYQAISACSMTIVITKKDKSRIPINFSGHNIELNIKGKFSTTDPEIQELLESSSAFNQNYSLYSTEKLADAKPKKTESSETGNASNIVSGGEELTPKEGFDTVSKAKAYLIENYSDQVTVSSLTTWAGIDEAATKLGFKFVR